MERSIRNLLITTVLVTASWTTAIAQDNNAEQATAKEADTRKALLGAWVLTGAPGNTLEPAADAEIKFWGERHFAVTKRNAATGKIDYHHMGTWTLNGDEYTETVTYGIGNTEDLVGNTYKFKIDVSGNTYLQRGIDNPWNQQWMRMTATTPSDGSTDGPKDPFGVREDASTEELFAFMDEVVLIQPQERTSAAIRAHVKQVYGAVVKAADVIIDRAESAEVVTRAVKKKFEAVANLANFDPSSRELLTSLSEKYADHEDPALAAVALGQLLQSQIPMARSATEEDALRISGEVLKYVDRFGASRDTYSVAARMASMLGYSDHQTIAADLYDKLAPSFRNADDESLRSRGEKMEGAARRLRLMGNQMELTGVTADGQEFRWDDYRGKVVLVDFWASWCGPCMAEIPNMKKNLERYGDRGFAIVGINMDSSREKFEACVQEREMSWVNLVSDDEERMGWDVPMASYYGITGIPTAILVDKEGKVVSLRARGAELDRQLAELLEPVDASGGAEADEPTENNQAEIESASAAAE